VARILERDSGDGNDCGDQPTGVLLQVRDRGIFLKEARRIKVAGDAT